MENNESIPTGIVIDFSCLKNKGLTPDWYLLLHWKYHNNYELQEEMKMLYLDDDPNVLMHLEKNGFIKITGNNEFELRQKGKDLFLVDDETMAWLEFLGKFPMKVPARGSGTRALKVANPDSKANVKLKKKYLSIIKGKPELHKRIINVLEAEVKMRKDSGQLQYMNAMEAWLNQANYDKYEYLLEEEKSVDYKNEDYM